ncbi:uncharacterized protein TA08135 [Theileria annulata]|uniref:ATPase AAA-type core domain-containing protein n=1 Tax=Theileria annulata TaxID=5874 RepID=Q4U9T2_THEAN|nr:uncharacterized protein TA08135 [Theileria annulata]CAI76421.1 hypothetical protein TA08135 [Theileria annulata]|eukprot:XP_953046.1 hypothetical protein TA08135 [Theileria annulata]
MGTFAEIELPKGYTVAFLYDFLKKSGVPVSLINLKVFRSAYNSCNFTHFHVFIGDSLSFLDKFLSEHLKKSNTFKHSFIIFDKFDLWPSCSSEYQVNKLDDNNSKSEHNRNNRVKSNNPYVKLLRLSEGVEERVEKCRINWVYKFFYWIRFSVLYLLEEQQEHSLVCLCLYGDPFNSKPFYNDIFTQKFLLKEFINFIAELNIIEHFEGDLEEIRDKKEQVDESSKNNIEVVKRISEFLDTYKPKDSNTNIDINGHQKSVYDKIDKDIRILNLYIPFEVDIKSLELGRVTLICGPESSGKTVLLRSIAKSWYHLTNSNHTSIELDYREDNTTAESCGYVINIDFNELLSELVGVSELYLKNIFVKAKYNKPCLVVFDGIECLLTKVNIEEERQVAVTVANILLNQLYNLDIDIKFLTSTSGDTDISKLHSSFLNIVDTLIVLHKS